MTSTSNRDITTKLSVGEITSVWDAIIRNIKAEAIIRGINVFWHFRQGNYSFVTRANKQIEEEEQQLRIVHPLAFLPPNDTFLFQGDSLIQEDGIIFFLDFEKREIILAFYEAEKYQTSDLQYSVSKDCSCKENISVEDEQEKGICKCDLQFREVVDILCFEDKICNGIGRTFLPIPNGNQTKQFIHFQSGLLNVFQNVQNNPNPFILSIVRNLGNFFGLSLEENDKPSTNKQPLIELSKGEQSTTADCALNKPIISLQSTEIIPLNKSNIVEKNKKTEDLLRPNPNHISNKQMSNEKERIKVETKLEEQLDKCEASGYARKAYSRLERLLYRLATLGDGSKKIQRGSDIKIHTKNKKATFLHIEHGRKSGKSTREIKKEVSSMRKGLLEDNKYKHK